MKLKAFLKTARRFRVSFRCLAIAVLAFIALASASLTMSAQVPAGVKRPANIPKGYLITPFGYFHPTCVKHIAKDDTLLKDEKAIRHADGSIDSIPTCNYPHYKANGQVIPSTGATMALPSPTISHDWVEDDDVTTDSSFGELTANWMVPAAPTSNDGQTLYFFPGMQDTNNVVSIIQPVLGWNADFSNAWGIAGWNCCVAGTVVESTAVSVNSGDTILGTIQSTCSAGTLSCPSWNITTKDITSDNSTELSQSSSYGQTFNWAFSGVMEVYNVTQCGDYPPNGSISFSNVALYDYNFSQISSPEWSFENLFSNLTPQCNYGGQGTATQATLDYGVVVNASSQNLDFGTFQNSSSRPVSKTVSFSNPGSTSITVSSVALQGSSDPNDLFFITSDDCTGTTLQGNDSNSCSVMVTYDPANASGTELDNVVDALLLSFSGWNTVYQVGLTATITCQPDGCSK